MSITSKTDIGNLALDLLSAGTVNDIESPTTATETLLNRWYDQSRRKILREHPWNFAIKRQVLAAESTVPAFGWSKAFPVPTDFIRILQVEGDDGQIFPSSQYQVENVNGVRCILLDTEASELRLVYVYDITDVTRFDPMFIDLLAYEIALSVAFKVTESNTNIDRIGQLHKMRGALARAIDGQERPPTRRETSRNLNARLNNRSTQITHRILF